MPSDKNKGGDVTDIRIGQHYRAMRGKPGGGKNGAHRSEGGEGMDVLATMKFRARKKTVRPPVEIQVTGKHGEHCLAAYSRAQGGSRCPFLDADRSGNFFCRLFPPAGDPTKFEPDASQAFLLADHGAIAREGDSDQPRRCLECMEAEEATGIVNRWYQAPPPHDPDGPDDVA